MFGIGTADRAAKDSLALDASDQFIPDSDHRPSIPLYLPLLIKILLLCVFRAGAAMEFSKFIANLVYGLK